MSLILLQMFDCLAFKTSVIFHAKKIYSECKIMHQTHTSLWGIILSLVVSGMLQGIELEQWKQPIGVLPDRHY